MFVFAIFPALLLAVAMVFLIGHIYHRDRVTRVPMDDSRYRYILKIQYNDRTDKEIITFFSRKKYPLPHGVQNAFFTPWHIKKDEWMIDTLNGKRIIFTRSIKEYELLCESTKWEN
ncbi:hypothetical protein [Listeria costaricensis]|uniref:hypothetical protein n=1 Tax=Listeria costaricensis TaxID=2026604 RepID=UPI000C087B30|nr:hypothetical protein [Listeria costaricensis]